MLRDALALAYEHWFWTSTWIFMIGGSYFAGRAVGK
jgi:hypothetical protein